MKVFPLTAISVNQAKELQFKIVNDICHEFSGDELLTLGDLGVKQPFNQPLFTNKVQKVIANIFGAPTAKLVTGAGTGALRFALFAALDGVQKRKVLVHDAPVYPTTKVSFAMLDLEVITADFNNLEQVKSVINANLDVSCCLIQITRQKLIDSYDAKQVIELIKQCNSQIIIITDDNYAVFKTGFIGTQLGADLATFSTFKLGGPEGVGCIVGNSQLIQKIDSYNYSGGSQIQGWQAYNVLQAFVAAPIPLAIQTEVCNQIVTTLTKLSLNGVKDTFVVNAQSRVVIVEFTAPIAKKILAFAKANGALPNPVGAESKYEFAPLFYRVSSTFRALSPTVEDYFIRINPNKAGSETVISILKEGLAHVLS